MSEKLKNCPFCGSKAEITEYGVWCKKAGNIEGACNAHLCYPAPAASKDIMKDIKKRSIEAWNRRFVCPDDKAIKCLLVISSSLKLLMLRE